MMTLVFSPNLKVKFKVLSHLRQFRLQQNAIIFRKIELTSIVKESQIILFLLHTFDPRQNKNVKTHKT